MVPPFPKGLLYKHLVYLLIYGHPLIPCTIICSPDNPVTVPFVLQGGVEFLVTLFVLCVDVMSGYTSLAPVPEASRALRFPQAVASLIKTYGDANSVRFDTYSLGLII